VPASAALTVRFSRIRFSPFHNNRLQHITSASLFLKIFILQGCSSTCNAVLRHLNVYITLLLHDSTYQLRQFWRTYPSPLTRTISMYKYREVIGSLCAHVLWQQNSINHFALRHERLHELHHNSARVWEAACDTCVMVNHKLMSAFLYWCTGSYPPNWVNIVIVHYSGKIGFFFRLNTMTSESPWHILSQRRQAMENLVYLNHCIRISQLFHTVWLSLNIFLSKFMKTGYINLRDFLDFLGTIAFRSTRRFLPFFTFLEIITHAFSNS
jgi:hypothetical protein